MLADVQRASVSAEATDGRPAQQPIAAALVAPALIGRWPHFAPTDMPLSDAELRELQRICAKKHEKARRRARNNQVSYETFDMLAVFAAQQWRCGFCGLCIDPRVRWQPRPERLPKAMKPDAMRYAWELMAAINAVTISPDHVIRLSKGGTHSAENVRATHQLCNAHGRDMAADIDWLWARLPADLNPLVGPLGPHGSAS